MINKREFRGMDMTLKSKFEESEFGRTISETSLPKFDLPKFEPGRFNRLKQDLTPPKFDLPKFESDGLDPDNSQPDATTITLPKLEQNWFSLLHRRFTSTKVGVTRLGLSKSHLSATSESSPNEQQAASSSSDRAAWPALDLSEVEFSKPNRRQREATHPRFDLPKFDDSNESEA
jgi:hypothetical protein